MLAEEGEEKKRNSKESCNLLSESASFGRRGNCMRFLSLSISQLYLHDKVNQLCTQVYHRKRLQRTHTFV